MYEDFRKFNIQSRPCIICNNALAENSERWAQDAYFEALKCNSCGGVQVEPCLNQEGLDLYYSTYLDHRLSDEKKFTQRSEQYIQDASFLERHRSSGKILDVGCSGGFFLNALSQNFMKSGIEIDKEAASYAREEFGLDVKAETLGEDSLTKSSYDVVIFRGVIEHILNPKSAVERATELLKPNGSIFICATPNLRSFCAHAYRSKWNLWHPIQHINIFDVETLHKMAGKDRFSIEAVDYPYLGTPYENEEQDYQAIINDLQSEANLPKSPPFWGNMLSVLFTLN
jgi:SAM-dependent methyltransferase